ncbi:MAG TPA: hypothetical protein QF753_18295 [Victivallales bacterium]|nr:hypothetical protein [Victivallales bacterium]
MKFKLLLIICLLIIVGISLPAQIVPANEEINKEIGKANSQIYPKIDPKQYKTYLNKHDKFFAETNKIVKKHKLNNWGKSNTSLYNDTKDTRDLPKRVRYNYQNVYGKPVLHSNVNNYSKLIIRQRAYWNSLKTLTDKDEQVSSIKSLKKEKVNREAGETQKKIDQSKRLGI